MAIKNIWARINIVIQDDKKVSKRIKSDREMMTKISTKKAKKKDERIFKDKLDRCFNILTCHCPYVSCLEMNCSGCQNLIHICCKYPTYFKIPVVEIPFLYKQLNKVGTKAKIAIGNADVVESKGMRKTEERKEEIRQGK